MDILGKIFGSEGRVRIMRLFLFNPGISYDIDNVSIRSGISKGIVHKEVANLAKIGLLVKKNYIKLIPQSKPKKSKSRKAKLHIQPNVLVKKKIQGWTLNTKFNYLKELQGLLINTILLKDEEINKRLSGVGKLKLVIVAGVFIQNWDSRVDLFVVGEKIQRRKLIQVIKRMEAEIGKELQYTYLDTQDFKYRMSIYDKLVRDVMDYPHQILLDKIGMKLGF